MNETKANLPGSAKQSLPGSKKNGPIDEQALLKAREARQNGLFPIARQLLDTMLNEHPKSAEVRKELITLHITSGEYDRAIDMLRQELKLVPDNHWALLSLGFCACRQGDSRSELDALLKAVSLNFEEMSARRLFELQRDASDFAGALATVRSLRKVRDTDELVVAELRLLARVGEKEASIAMSKPLLDRVPLLRGAVEHWVAYYLSEKNDPETVIGELEQRVRAGCEEPVFLASLSRAFHRMDRAADAIAYLRKALDTEPDNRQWWYDLAVQERQIGEIQRSQVSLQRALELDPLDPVALRVFGAEHSYSYGDPALKSINQALAKIDLIPKTRQVELHYAAAKAYEDVGELDAAFEHYRQGGRKQTEITPYRETNSIGLLKTLRLGMRPSTYDAITVPGASSTMPVFVLGMPRSGTTLVEQIISSHPNAHGAGELKLLHRVLDGISVNGTRIQTSAEPGVIPTFIPGVDLNCTKLGFKERGERYVEAITALARAAGRNDVLRVVDKMPGNYFWTGLVPFVLPNARIVHTRRHPADICLSNYRIFFPDGMPWSYDLRDLGKCYRAYHEHMLHWESNLPPGLMLSVRYEDVVADVDGMARKIISHIGLEWDDACLRFYENERSVKTASLGQVRQPIYNSSVGRWRKYEKFLKPLIDEISPLIESYESELAEASGLSLNAA